MDIILSLKNLELVESNRVWLYDIGNDGELIARGPGLRSKTEIYIDRGFLVMDEPLANL